LLPVAVLQAAIANLRPATMELGGKSCLIIFDDAGKAWCTALL
jgi:acyl-CoA reductase-like NAD-dependent aldehyde dehydrogenase